MTPYIIQQLHRVAILVSILCTLALGSCLHESAEWIPPTAQNQTQLTFSVNLPAKAQTYALESTNENSVSTIYVLVFAQQNGTYVLQDWAQASASSISNDGGSHKKRFTTTFTQLQLGNSYKFVLLANAHTQLEDMELAPGTPRDALLQSIKLASTTRWNVNPTDEQYRDIPMWGETQSDATVNEALQVTGINLVRMLARINVVVSHVAPSGEPAAANSYFQLRSVHLYNAQQAGHVVPNLLHLATGSMHQVVRPTLVSGAVPNPTPLVYGPDMVSSNALLNTLYTFESEVPKLPNQEVDHNKLTALVIGGVYGNDSQPTYYRVNLKREAEGVPVYLDILRNHSYTVNVVKIKGSGYDTPQDAFNSKALNMDAEVTSWNEGQVGEIHESDGYHFVISPSSELKFYRGGYAQTVELTTSHPQGWRVTKVTESDQTTPIPADSGWLQLNRATGVPQGVGGVKASLTLTTTPNNTSAVRVGYVFVQFAKTVVRLQVTQTLDEVTTLEVTANGKPIQELLFTAANELQAQNFVVSWFSQDGKLTIANTAIGTAFQGTGIPLATAVAGANGTITYAVKPTAFTAAEKNTMTEKGSKLDFTIFDGTKNVVSTLFVKHINYLLTTDAKAEYDLDGSTYTFTVKSNAKWKIKSITESTAGKVIQNKPTDNLKVDQTVYDANATTGKVISFTTAANYTAGAAVTIVFESANLPKLFADKELVVRFKEKSSNAGNPNPSLHKGWAGSNIYWNGTKLTFDDVGDDAHKNQQGVYFKWGSLWGISPQGEWSGSTILYAPNGTRGTATSYGKSEWNTIEPVTETVPPPAGVAARDFAQLAAIDITDGKTTGLGDICRYITQQAGGTLHGKKWRMPTSNEFEAASSYTKFGGFGAVTSSDAAGFFLMTSGYVKSDAGKTVSLPASGYRSYSAGQLSYVGTTGYYWSSSPNGAFGYYLLFYSTAVGPSNDNLRASGFSVRCVAE